MVSAYCLLCLALASLILLSASISVSCQCNVLLLVMYITMYKYVLIKDIPCTLSTLNSVVLNLFVYSLYFFSVITVLSISLKRIKIVKQ